MEQLGPGSYASIVSGVPADPGARPEVMLKLAASFEDAQENVTAMAIKMGARVRELGGVIEDVEVDD